jgi:hypothetical protein
MFYPCVLIKHTLRKCLNTKKESRTRLVECPSFKGKVFGSNPNVFIKSSPTKIPYWLGEDLVLKKEVLKNVSLSIKKCKP